MKAHKDSEVPSHLIRYGFVKDYMVWTFHGEKVVDATVGNAFGGNSMSSMTVNAELVGRQPASSLAPAASDDNDNARDYITIEDLFEDIGADNDGGGASDEDAAVRDMEGVELMEEIANRLDEDALDPLYKGCPKHWTALHFDLTMIMLKGRHGWSDTSFIDLMTVLADTYSYDNKVPANTYRAKKLIRPVAMKLRKFDASPNYCILYRGEQYEELESCPHYGASRYKRNVSCCVDANGEGPVGGSKKKKQFLAQLDEEELGYM
jgi:hypothetical protein